jgi:PKD repeat protein
MTLHPGKMSLLFTAIALLAGCGGGGGGGDGPVTPPLNTPPVASFTATPSSGAAPVTVQFDASTSTDPGGSIAGYNWSFGDGSGPGTGVTTSHTYSAAGTFTVTLTVTDNLGATGSTSRQITAAAAPPAGPVNAIVRYPGSGVQVPDSFEVVVSVTSTYEIRSVIASLAGQEVALAYSAVSDNYCPFERTTPCYRGTLSLAGQPVGPYTLTTRATDVRGNVDIDSVNITHDNPAVLTILKPLDKSVALGTATFDFRCTDDVPGCTVELYDMNNRRIGVAEGALSMSVAVPPGSVWEFLFVAIESGTRRGTHETRRIYGEDPAQLAILSEVPGVILDADETSLLYPESRFPIGHPLYPYVTGLAVYNRVTGLTERIILPPDLGADADEAYLTPTGAIFVAGIIYPLDHLYLWRDGAVNDLGTVAPGSLAVSSRYAIWRTYEGDGHKLYRLNTDSGSPTPVPGAGEAPASAAVAADGTVDFVDAEQNLIRDRAGVQTILASDTTVKQWLVTDGNLVVFRRKSDGDPTATVLIENGTQIVLSDRPSDGSYTTPWRDHQIRNGWTAYTELGSMGQSHVFTRSPQGATRRLTDFAASSTIDRLGDAGQVMIYGPTTRYFSNDGGMLPVSSSNGRSYWLGGRWYLTIGCSFLSVNTGN